MHYKKWVFRLFICVLTLNIVFFVLIDVPKFAPIMMILRIISTICLIAGGVMVALCIKNRELNDTRTWAATVGLLLSLLMSIVLYF